MKQCLPLCPQQISANNVTVKTFTLPILTLGVKLHLHTGSANSRSIPDVFNSTPVIIHNCVARYYTNTIASYIKEKT